MAERYIRNGMPERRQVERRVSTVGYLGPERRQGVRREDERRPSEKLKGDWLKRMFWFAVAAGVLVYADQRLADGFYLAWLKQDLLAVAARTREWSDNLWK